MINNIIKPDECRVSEAGDFVPGQTGFTKTIHYRNYTEEVVYVRDRTGTVVKLNPTTNIRYRGESALVVQIQMHMDHATAAHNYDRVIAMRPDERSFVDKMFMENYGDAERRNMRPLSLSMIYTINKTHLIAGRGISFIDTTDTLAFIGPGCEYVDKEYVPGTNDHDISSFHKEMRETEGVSFDPRPFLWMVRIIDNESPQLPVYWTNFSNRVYSIRSERSKTLKSGFYVINREQETEARSDNLIAYYYTPEQFRVAEDFPIYTSYLEALANPSHPQVKNMKDILREQAAKASKAEIEAGEARERQKRESVKHEQEKANRAEDLKAAKRKNTFELFKYGPMIINGLIALTLIIVSLVTKTPVKAPPIKI